MKSRQIIYFGNNDNYTSYLVPKSQRKPLDLLIEVKSTAIVHHNMKRSFNSIETKRQRKLNRGKYVYVMLISLSRFYV